MASLFPCFNKKSGEDAADPAEGGRVKVKPKRKEPQPDPQLALVSIDAVRVVNTVTVETQTPEDHLPESQPVLLDTERKLMRELGLGRGVDGTNPTPWLKRTAFQVRRVTDTPNRIVGTDEGGTLQKYVREVTNVRSQQSTLKASIDVPKAPIIIGVDAEYSRTFTKSRKSVGIRIHNRTVSFASDFDEASDWMFRDSRPPPTKDQKDKHGIKPKGGGDVPAMDADELTLSFEERMCQWILEHQEGYEKKVHKEPDKVPEGKAEEGGGGGGGGGGEGGGGEGGGGGDDDDGAKGSSEKRLSPIVKEFTQYFMNHSEEAFRSDVDDHCKRFVEHFRITHYVSAIQLGAVKYDVLEEEEYNQKFGSATHVAVEKVGELDFSTNLKWKRTVKDETLSKIGIMSDDPVRVRRADEAVIGAEIKPLSRLIHHPLLCRSLQRVLKDYMDKVQDDREGPFYIACDDDKLFLMVTERNEVIGERHWQKASKFFIVPTYNSEHPHEFAIAYDTKKEGDYRDVKPISRYLNAYTSLVFGQNDGPLKMEFGISEHNCRLSLRNRLSTSYKPGDITPWVAGQEGCYLHCARRHIRKNGYVCVKPASFPGRSGNEASVKQEETTEHLVTACVWSAKKHDEDKKVYMVFRLIRPEQFPKPIKEEDDEKKKEEDKDCDSDEGLEAAQEGTVASGPPAKGIPSSKKLVVTAQIDDTSF